MPRTTILVRRPRSPALLLSSLLLVLAAAPAAAEIQLFPAELASGYTLNPTSITLGPDGNLWFVDESSSSVCRITREGEVTAYQRPRALTQPQTIVAGADGRLWVTVPNNGEHPHYVFAVSALEETLGEGASYDLPTVGAAPMGAALGQAGAVWFTEAQYNNIAWISPFGDVVEYHLEADAVRGLFGIARGPDDAMWFTEYQPPARVGRIDPVGRITEFDLPTPDSYPVGIVASEGALWVSHEKAAMLTRVTTAGEATEFPLPCPEASVYGLAAGPDGAVWFTQRTGSEGNVRPSIGRMTANGQVTQYPLPDAVEVAVALAFDRNGNLWFTDWFEGWIGRAELPMDEGDGVECRDAGGGGGGGGGGQEPPPPGEWLTSPALPGFEAKVRITAGGATLDGRRVEDCIVNTLCVSGAVAGQPEVFVRVVGPKPNGYLWPTLVKFSTSQVDVWIRQLEGGAVNHYLLPAVTPGAAVLNLAGLADKLGFLPVGTAGSARLAALIGDRRSAVAPAGSVAPVPKGAGPPPPAGEWLTSPALPGFGAKVRITGGSSVIEGSVVEDCIVNTLCVGGAVAGQPEVFLRIAGPKPNGMLWPTLVKFSTSQVEVWIEQTATGTVQYYRLEAVTPGANLLDLAGLADKQGFSP